jgi:hypothetical protein
MATKKPDESWIRIQSGSNQMFCERCGDTYKPELPCPIDMFLAMIKSYRRLHKSCRKRK